MVPFCRTAASALLCCVLSACGGGGGGGGGSGGGDGTPSIPTPNAFLPTDTSIRLTYANQGAPAQFETTTQRNSEFVAPFRYATGGKEYYISTSDAVSFAGFYSPQVVVGGAGTFTADARFDTPVTLFRSDSDARQVSTVSGDGTVTISPTYGEQRLTYSGTVTYLGGETITTSLGRFATRHVNLSLVVSTSIQGTAFNLPFFVDLWFARDIGIVRRVEAGQQLQLAQATGPDSDGDGLFNGLDRFPNDPAESSDFDGDGRGDNGDTDDDNDGAPDESDRFPRDATESADFDNDGVGDNADIDDDNDGLPDSIDPFPRDVHNTDTDSDGTADFYDTDDDDDGVADVADRFPLDPDESLDTDNDGIGDNRDTDDDNDGHPDAADAHPTDPTRWELLNVDRSALSLAAVFGSAAMPATHVNVIGDNVSWQAQSSASWLQLSSQAGTGDSLVIVTTNTHGLAAGVHNATLTFSDASLPRSVEVDVQMTVTLPVLSVTSAAVAFDGKFGWSELTRPIDVSLDTGLNSYPVSVAMSFDVPGAITTAFPDGVADSSPHRLNVTLDPAQLRSGRHIGRLTLTANVNGQLITREVTLEAVASERLIYPSNDAVALAMIGVYPSLNRTITVLDSYGVAGTAWSASGDQPWLQVATPNGVSGGALTISADPSGLAEGLYRGTVTLSSDDVHVERALPINVSLWVQAAHRNVGESLAATYTQLAGDPLRPYVYAHNGGGAIDVFNVHTRDPLTSIVSLGGVLGPMATSSDGKWLFVLDPVNGSVTRIDLDDTAVRTIWPLTDLKPPGQPSTFVYARPSGHPVLLLSDRRVVDAVAGTVLPTGQLSTLPTFDVMRSSLQGDRVCVLTTQQSPFSGRCFAMAFGDYDTPDVHVGPLMSISGFNVPGAGFAADLAVSADGSSAIVGIRSNALPVVRFSALTGGYLGPVLAADATQTARGTRGVATGSDGAIYADVIGNLDGIERLHALNGDGSVRVNLQFSNTSVTGMFRQLVVTGDGMGAVYLTGLPQPTVSTELNFLRSY